MPFVRAQRKEAKARIAIVGPSGSGKTYTALQIAAILADGKPVALVDTEHGSASKYGDRFVFDAMELDDFHPRRYVAAMREAAAAGYGAVVLDSLTHAWKGRGGILEIVGDRGAQGWKAARPIEVAFIEAILTCPIHVVATIRARQTVEFERDANGALQAKKLGLQAEQREDLEYEFDQVFRMDIANTLRVEKTRCPEIAGGVYACPTLEPAATLRDWLKGSGDSGPSGTAITPPDPTPAPSAPRPAPRPAPAPSAKPAQPKPAPRPVEPTPPSEPEGFDPFSDPEPEREDDAPAAQPASGMSLPGFLGEAQRLYGLTPREVMERLGVRTLAGVNYAEALAAIGRQQASAKRAATHVGDPSAGHRAEDARREGKAPSVAKLRIRARGVQIESEAEWEAFTLAILGEVADGSAWTDDQRRKVEHEIARREAEPVIEFDLREVGTVGRAS